MRGPVPPLRPPPPLTPSPCLPAAARAGRSPSLQPRTMLRTHRTTAKPCLSHPEAAGPSTRCWGEAAGGGQERGGQGLLQQLPTRCPPPWCPPGAHRAPLQPLASASAANPAPGGRGRRASTRHGQGDSDNPPAAFLGEQGLSPPLTTWRWKRGPVRPALLGVQGSPGAPSRSRQAAARLAPFSAALNIPLGRRARFIKQTIGRQSSPALIAQQRRSLLPVKTL